MATTSSTCSPSARPLSVRGETQSGTTMLSSSQENDTPAWSAVSVNVALVLVVVDGAAGTFAVIVVVGAPTTVHSYGADAGPMFRLGSIARTSSVCWPASCVSSYVLSGGAAQAVNSAPSTEHSNEASNSLLEKTN